MREKDVKGGQVNAWLDETDEFKRPDTVDPSFVGRWRILYFVYVIPRDDATSAWVRPSLPMSRHSLDHVYAAMELPLAFQHDFQSCRSVFARSLISTKSNFKSISEPQYLREALHWIDQA